jgi:hypothetical protein
LKGREENRSRMREQKGLGYFIPHPYLLRYIKLNLAGEARRLLQRRMEKEDLIVDLRLGVCSPYIW